jgi:hypothetical protein
LPREIWLESADGEAFNVIRAESNLKWVKVAADLGQVSRRHRLSVRLVDEPVTATIKLDGELRVQTTLPGAEYWRIPVEGFVVSRAGNGP